MPVVETLLDLRTIEFDGDIYDFYHDGFNIKQIMKNDKEIAWSELPNVLKGLL